MLDAEGVVLVEFGLELPLELEFALGLEAEPVAEPDEPRPCEGAAVVGVGALVGVGVVVVGVVVVGVVVAVTETNSVLPGPTEALAPVAVPEEADAVPFWRLVSWSSAEVSCSCAWLTVS
jgi:hypothetical protein